MSKFDVKSIRNLTNLIINRGNIRKGFLHGSHLINSLSRWQTLLGFLLLITPQISWSAGTPAGTPIRNTATLSYSLGTSLQADIPATSMTFLVDEKINLTVVGGVTTNVLPGSFNQATPFAVTNNANSTLDFALSVTEIIGGDQFDPNTCIAYAESGTATGYQASQDTATFLDELAPDATATVYAVCDIPAAANFETGMVGLTATARGDFTGPNGTYAATAGTLGAVITPTTSTDTPGSVDIVFADVAGSEDITSDAKHSARNTYLIAGSALSLTKTVASVLDPQGGSILMPGSVITYQIAVAVTGTGNVSSLMITDPLPAETSYVSNSILITCNTGTYAGGGACGTGTITPQPPVTKTDTNLDVDFVDFNGTTANTVTVSLGDVTAPADFVITFNAAIK